MKVTVYGVHALYAEDSFFTLGTGGQIGLAMLSTALAIAFLVLTWRLGRSMPRAARLFLAMVLFWTFLWLTPQLYYLYYQSIIPGLPWQIVVGSPPRLLEVSRLLSFTGETNLSDHGKGVLGWAMIAVAFPNCRNAAN